MEELFSLTDNIPTTTIDRKKHSVDSISNLPSFLDSLHFHDYNIKSGSNSKKLLRELIESTIQHYKFEKMLEKRYYTEDEINSMIEKFM